MLAFVASQPLELLHISIVTLAQIRFGIELVPDPARRSELIDWLTHKVRPMSSNERRCYGRRYGFTVVSRDTSEYVKARVSVFNPWIDNMPESVGPARND